jgi:uncharacterized protein YifN (PemK superfamily)
MITLDYTENNNIQRNKILSKHFNTQHERWEQNDYIEKLQQNLLYSLITKLEMVISSTLK